MTDHVDRIAAIIEQGAVRMARGETAETVTRRVLAEIVQPGDAARCSVLRRIGDTSDFLDEEIEMLARLAAIAREAHPD